MVTARSATGLFVLLAALWGTSYVAVKAALPALPPLLLAALRYDIAGVLVLAYAVGTTDRWRPSTRADFRLIATGGTLLIAANYGLLFSGQQYLTSAAAAIVAGLTPVLTSVFAAVLLTDERLGSAGIVGTVLGFAGVAIIARPDPANLLSSDMLGVGFVMLATASFALGTVLTRRFRTTLPLVSMQAWMMLVGAVLLHIASIASPAESLRTVEWTGTAVIAVGYLAIVAGAGGFLLYFALLDQLGAFEINLVTYVAPVFAALAGWMLLGERFCVETALGFACIIAGFALIKWDALLGIRDRAMSS